MPLANSMAFSFIHTNSTSASSNFSFFFSLNSPSCRPVNNTFTLSITKEYIPLIPFISTPPISYSPAPVIITLSPSSPKAIKLASFLVKITILAGLCFCSKSLFSGLIHTPSFLPCRYILLRPKYLISITL